MACDGCYPTVQCMMSLILTSLLQGMTSFLSSPADLSSLSTPRHSPPAPIPPPPSPCTAQTASLSPSPPPPPQEESSSSSCSPSAPPYPRFVFNHHPASSYQPPPPSSNQPAPDTRHHIHFHDAVDIRHQPPDNSGQHKVKFVSFSQQ